MLFPLPLLWTQPLPSAPSLASTHLQQPMPSPHTSPDPPRFRLRTLSPSCPASTRPPSAPFPVPRPGPSSWSPISQPSAAFPQTPAPPRCRYQSHSPLSHSAAAVAHSLKARPHGEASSSCAGPAPAQARGLHSFSSRQLSPLTPDLRLRLQALLPCLSLHPHASKAWGAAQPGCQGWEIMRQRG